MFVGFVWNPEGGPKNFKEGRGWWHAKSWWVFGLFPADYPVSWLICVGLIFAADWRGYSDLLPSNLALLAYFLAYTFFTIFFVAPVYQKWYRWMRRKDDRDKTRIFHIQNSP